MADDESFRKAHIESCRRGGKHSGQTRREQGARINVEHAIRSRLAVSSYDRYTAGKIAGYLGISARFVRRVAAEIKAEQK